MDGRAGPKTMAKLNSLISEGSKGKEEKPGETNKGSSSSNSNKTTGALKKGSKGDRVTELQKMLKTLGYLSGKVDGSFGGQTERDVKAFQKANGLAVDGSAGPKTMAKINELISKGSEETGNRGEDRPETSAPSGKVEMIHWSTVDTLWTRVNHISDKSKGEARITDIDTGKSFMVVRSGGYNHADVETASAADTKIFRSIYGGVDSWNRRAIIVEVAGKRIAASMAGYPHAGRDDMPNRAMVSNRSGDYGYGQNLDLIKGNNMDGVFDVHFYGSKTHGTNKVCDKHQAQVKRAAASN